MTATFNIGDTCILARCDEYMVGKEVEIVGTIARRHVQNWNRVITCYSVKILESGMVVGAQPGMLDPLPDGNIPISWAECHWRPNNWLNR